MTLSKSTAYAGNATIDHSLAKDGKLKIHGLCRYAKVDDVKSWRRSKDLAGRELTFSDPKRLVGYAYLDSEQMWDTYGRKAKFLSVQLGKSVPTLTIEPTSVPSSRSVAYSWRGLLLEEMGPTPSNM